MLQNSKRDNERENSFLIGHNLSVNWYLLSPFQENLEIKFSILRYKKYAHHITLIPFISQ